MEKSDVINALGIMDEIASRGKGCWDKESRCCCPFIVFYDIKTRCLTINNGACPDWDFCEPCNATAND